MNTNELSSVDVLFDSIPKTQASKHITTENGVSAKSWYPLDNKEIDESVWSCNEMNVVVYSTGLCKMTFSVKPVSMVYTWVLRILDSNDKPLICFDLAPISIESKNRLDYRMFKVERRYHKINEDLINKAYSIQIINY